MLLKAGELDEEERQLRVVPAGSHIRDQKFLQLDIIFRVAGVALALIPEYPADRIDRPRRKHGVVKCRGKTRMAFIGGHVRQRIRADAEAFQVGRELEPEPPFSAEADLLIPGLQETG